MTNPLDEKYESYETIKAALKLLRVLLKAGVQKRLALSEQQIQGLLSETDLHGMTVQEVRDRLDKCIDGLEGLTVLTLFAEFEKTLRLHLQSQMASVGTSSSVPTDLAQALKDHLDKESLWWRSDEVMELFAPPVSSNTKGTAKQIKDYRDYVAHLTRPSTKATPEQTYQALCDFLTEAALLPPTGGSS